MDLTALTDNELTAHRVAVLMEVERRQRLVALPAAIEATVDQYLAAGGDGAALSERINRCIEAGAPTPDTAPEPELAPGEEAPVEPVTESEPTVIVAEPEEPKPAGATDPVIDGGEV